MKRFESGPSNGSEKGRILLDSLPYAVVIALFSLYINHEVQRTDKATQELEENIRFLIENVTKDPGISYDVKSRFLGLLREGRFI